MEFNFQVPKLSAERFLALSTFVLDGLRGSEAYAFHLMRKNEKNTVASLGSRECNSWAPIDCTMAEHPRRVRIWRHPS